MNLPMIWNASKEDIFLPMNRSHLERADDFYLFPRCRSKNKHPARIEAEMESTSLPGLALGNLKKRDPGNEVETKSRQTQDL